ncbi:MAG: hypothetical protein A2X46_05125 [Lentisphaerae bacterium GWF2_57_35]|nr:MAG: hypothetical protein A2X46_05125 [Lentisphaerae bacterium GWF2_57_35]
MSSKWDANQRSDFMEGFARKSLVDEMLANLLNHARIQVPRIRDLLGRSTTVSPLDAQEVLRSLPVMQRPEIQNTPEYFVSEGAEGLRRDATGGSTGTPMQFWVDKTTQIAREASLLWADGLTGWAPGQKIAMLWGSDRDVSSSMANLRLALRWRVENRRWYNAFNMGPDQMIQFHRSMERFCPAIIVAYAGSIFEYARFLEEHDLRPDYPSRAIVSSAERLDPHMRACIERVFKRPVFDRYGNRETGAIAAECTEHQGLHILCNDFIVEIEGEDSGRSPGRLLLTYLHNYGMPFLRYDTGDLACWEPSALCVCGRSTPRLKTVVGRQADVIRTPSGRFIHGEYFTHLLYSVEGVAEFCFVQENLAEYTLVLVADQRKVQSQENTLLAQMRAVIGESACIRIMYAPGIPLTPSGKRRFTYSKLNDMNEPTLDQKASARFSFP